MKENTLRYLKMSLYDVAYLLNFVDETTAKYYDKQIEQILKTAQDIDKGIKEYN